MTRLAAMALTQGAENKRIPIGNRKSSIDNCKFQVSRASGCELDYSRQKLEKEEDFTAKPQRAPRKRKNLSESFASYRLGGFKYPKKLRVSVSPWFKFQVRLACLILTLSLLAPVSLASEPNSVLLITIDTLRADRVNRELTPNLAALADHSFVLENAITPVPLTLPAHASLLTGLYPMYHGVRDFSGQGLAEEFTTLAEIYRQAGFETAAFVSAFVVDGRWGLSQGFQVYYDDFDDRLLDSIQPGRIERSAPETLAKVFGWLKEPRERPFFLWIHLFEPHSGYDPPEPFRSRFQDRLYDGEVAFVDDQIGRLIEKLKDQGLFENLNIVVTSDHGESLGEHGEQEHGFFLYDATIRVPLIIKLPGQRSSGTIDSPVSLVDIAPTLLQISGLPSRPEMQGQGFFASLRGRQPGREQGAYSETLYPYRSFGWHDLKAYRTDRYKFIKAPSPELYDLQTDPGEAVNLFGQNQALALKLRERLRELDRKFSARSGATPVPVADPEMLNKLRSLGYLSYSAPLNPVSEEISDRADPKDKIETFNKILRAMDLADGGRLVPSNEILQEVIRQEASLPLVQNLLGQNYLRMGQSQRAIEQFQDALKVRPDWEEAIFNLARAYLEAGDTEAARVGFQRVLEINSANFLARFNLGSLLMSQSLTEALNHLQEAEKIRQDFAPLQRNLGVVLADVKRFSEAELYLKRALALEKEDPVSLNYLGIVYRNTDRLQQARKAYQQALSLKPDYAAAALNLAFVLRQLGKIQESEKAFRRACDLNETLCSRYRSYFRQTP